MNVEENNSKLTSEMERSATKQRETIGRTRNKRWDKQKHSEWTDDEREHVPGQKGLAQR
jgi:hypothetical protein